MSLRWRRSLPTENARVPAPVTMATRTDGRTAIVSRISVSRAPISVVIALSACGDEGRQFLQAAADGPLRDREAARPFLRSDEGVLLGRSADEDAVVQPLGLDELELALQVRAGEHEDDPAVLAVVLEHPFGQHRT